MTLEEYYNGKNLVDEKAEEPVLSQLLDPASLIDESKKDFRFNTPMKPREAGDAQDTISINTADNTEQSLCEEALDSEENKSPKPQIDEKDELEIRMPQITIE